MKTDIYYFSATGNCLSSARKLAEKIGNSRVISIPNIINRENRISGDRIGIVRPICMYTRYGLIFHVSKV